jgi:hypothetical protein
LFTQSFGGFIPDPAGVTEIQVRGTMNGHAINMLMLDVGAAGQDIVGVGTMEKTLTQLLAGAALGSWAARR